MRQPGRIIPPIVCLGAAYLVVIFAGFIAPYDPASQNRHSASTSPMRIHWIDNLGHLHWRPFVYEPTESGREAYATTDGLQTLYPIVIFPRGASYNVLGLFAFDRHLFGVTPPGNIYLAGTDGYGRDVFTRILYGGQVSLFAGLLATVFSLSLALVLGTLAGFYGGWADTMLMRSVELFLALPWLYLLLALRASLPLHSDPRSTFLLLITVIGILGWGRPARLIRGVVLSVRERSHITAARCFGASDLYLLRRHILPETRSIVVTQAALLVPQYVLAEATLSFLGLGVAEPVPSWGSMLALVQQYHVLVSEWWMFLPGLAMILVFLAFGVLANRLQEKTAEVQVRRNARASLDMVY